MSAGHTPGPLQLVEGYEVWDIRGDGQPGIPLIRADLGLNRKWGREIGGSEIAANLRLFAAAPEHDECLWNAVALFGSLCTDEPQLVWLAQAKASLAKARGEAA